MCRQYVLSRATSGTTSGTTVTSITSIFGTGNTIGVHKDCWKWCVHLDMMCKWCADDMWMTCVSVDDMCMTPGIVLYEIGQLRQVCGWCLWMTCASVDNVQPMYQWRMHVWMTCGWCMCVQLMCRWCADNVCMCEWHVDNVLMTYVICQWNLIQSLTLRWAHRLHIICRCTHHFQQSLWIPVVFPVPKILVIDVTVVPDVALLKILPAHHPWLSPLSPWTPIVFSVPKIVVIDVTVVPDMWMTCGRCADNVHACGWHVHDTRCSTAWNWATQASADDIHVCGWHVDVIHTWCGQRADNMQTTYVICRWNLTPNLTLMSSARHLHIVSTRFQPQKYFQLNSRATALLKRELKKTSNKMSDFIDPINSICLIQRVYLETWWKG